MTSLETDQNITLTWQSIFPAPAKLNLFLHVVGQKKDGYHLLQTAFRFLDFADYLRFAPRQDGQIVLDNPLPNVAPEDNLCFRAARLLQQKTACSQGASISLIKNLPMGAGLGGGSSDAATVLLALNHLWQTGLSRAELQQLGVQLGADVPVFIFGQNAFGQGIGEELSALDMPHLNYLLAMPKVHIATPLIFSAPNLCRNTPKINPEDWQNGFGHNDLEPVACALFPAVLDYIKQLSKFGNAKMTGSGACVFVEFPDKKSAQEAEKTLPKSMQTWLVDGLKEHPLRSLANDF